MIELFAAVMLGCGGGPGPDPNPGTTRPVTCTDWSYDYRLPAVDEATGQEIPGMYFACHHPKDGRDTCVLVTPHRFQRRIAVRKTLRRRGTTALLQPSAPQEAQFASKRFRDLAHEA